MLQTAQRQSKTKKNKPAPPHERFSKRFGGMLLSARWRKKLVVLYRGGPIIFFGFRLALRPSEASGNFTRD